MVSYYAWLACYHLFKMFASNMHQNELFQVRFFKNFLERSSPSPSPYPSPVFFSSFLLGSGFALNSQAFRAFDSRALFSILWRFAPSIRALPSTFDWRSWFGPQNKFMMLPWLNGSPFKIPACYCLIQKWLMDIVLGFREDYFIVGVTNTSWSLSQPTRGQYPLCGQYCSTARWGGTLVVYCRRNTIARYVIIQQPADGSGYLNFCELEVFSVA